MNEAQETAISHRALHIGFTFIYLLLISWFFVSIFSQIDPRFRLAYKFVDRLSICFYRPFMGTIVWVDVQAVLYAIFSFAFLHCAIVRAYPIDADSEMLTKLINFFRFTFFLTATLLALLIVIRLTIDTYRDITGRGRATYSFERIIATPSPTPSTNR